VILIMDAFQCKKFLKNSFEKLLKLALHF